MKHKSYPRPALWVTGCILLLWTGWVEAATDAYLKLGDIKGESADAVHGEWIDVISMEWGMTGDAVSAQLGGLEVVKRVDAASPLLQLACAEGRHFPKATLDLVRPGDRRVRFYRIVLEDVMVRSVEVSGSGEPVSPPPMEHMRLDCARMSWTYTEFSPDGRSAGELTSFWDSLEGVGDFNAREATRVSGAPGAVGGELDLRFPATVGVTYRILGSDDPSGPFVEVRRFTSDTGGAAAVSLPLLGDRRFFTLEELP